MGAIKRPTPVKLFCGFIFRDEEAFVKARRALASRFGPIDSESPVFDFSHTDYYAKEFGPGLKRKFASFKKLILPGRLAAIKALTNSIERRLSREGRRLVNIDPGYLDMAKVVLASTKDYTHRLYVGNGVYAEVTLFYKDNSFRAWEWTYPDYKSAEYAAFFCSLRKLYASQRKGIPH